MCCSRCHCSLLNWRGHTCPCFPYFPLFFFFSPRLVKYKLFHLLISLKHLIPPFLKIKKMDGKLRTVPASSAQPPSPTLTPMADPSPADFWTPEGSLGHIPRLTHSPAQPCSTRWLLALLLALAASGMQIFCGEQSVWARWMDINIYEHS